VGVIAFKVPRSADEIAEARFFGYPLHDSNAREHILPCFKHCTSRRCSACRQLRWDHDPGDEDRA
jgi:hypothetical protein